MKDKCYLVFFIQPIWKSIDKYPKVTGSNHHWAVDMGLRVNVGLWKNKIMWIINKNNAFIYDTGIW